MPPYANIKIGGVVSDANLAAITTSLTKKKDELEERVERLTHLISQLSTKNRWQ